jgi:pimeloyl-ACP methyl ester carboxylesterase
VTISEKTIKVEGSPVHYFEGGADNGRALLLLSGGIGDARTNWSAVMPVLSESFHVFAPDLPGFGSSTALPEMSLERLIHWLRALLDALHQTDAVLVGSFLGGTLARLFAAAEPQYVPAIILVNGGTIPRVPALLQPLVGMPLIGGLITQAFGNMPPLHLVIQVKTALSEDLLTAQRANATASSMLMRSFLLSPAPEKQTPLVPTLLLWGMNDPVVTPAHAARLQSEIPGAQFSPIADCGHMPQLEATDPFLFQVTTFLDRITRPVAPVLPGVGLLNAN